jgi:hypothetical protein
VEAPVVPTIGVEMVLTPEMSTEVFFTNAAAGSVATITLGLTSTLLFLAPRLLLLSRVFLRSAVLGAFSLELLLLSCGLFLLPPLHFLVLLFGVPGLAPGAVLLLLLPVLLLSFLLLPFSFVLLSLLRRRFPFGL